MNSSVQQAYETPWSHVRAVERDSFGGVPFALDAAATPANRKAPTHYDTSTNGLSSPWIDGTWCNPPYEHQGDWLARAVYWARQGVHSASLVLGPRFRSGVVRYRDARSGELIGRTDQISFL